MKPKGQLFSHVYLGREAPVLDSEHFRRRLGGYVESTLRDDRFKLKRYLKTETGLTVRLSSGQSWVSCAFEEFFITTPVSHLLNVITLIWRFIWENHKTYSKRGDEWIFVCPKADHWRAFVSRAFREENLGYALDEQCGVDYLVDKEFEQNRVSL